MVLASAGDDGKVSFWRRNGTRLWVVPSINDGGGIVEVPTFFFLSFIRQFNMHLQLNYYIHGD